MKKLRKLKKIFKKLFSKKFIKLKLVAFYYKFQKVKKNIIVYESFFGRGVTDNPYAIFNSFMADSSFSKYKHYWVIDNFRDNKIIIKKYKKLKNVYFIKHNSLKYIRLLCSSKYLINNVTFPSWFIKKDEQVYINTWHGIPLKTLGYDMPNGNLEVSNTVRNFLMTDYLISPNEFMTDLYLNSAFKLREIYRGKIITNGYPRLDLLTTSKREDVINLLLLHKVRIDPNKKIILYAPTWKGSSYNNASSDVESYFELKNYLEKQINADEYQILIKPHQRVFQIAKDKFNLDFCIPACIDANEILSITDILISDFSSIFFDFLATNKPVLFYISDLDEYKKDRGLYFNINSLPGPIAENLNELVGNIKNIESVIKEYSKKYNEIREFANARINENISSIILDGIFNNNSNKMTFIKTEKKKETILFNRGPMYVNGISTSFLNLLNYIDYSRFDVSIVLPTTKKSQEKELINSINSNCRVFCKDGAKVLTLFEQILNYFSKLKGKALNNKEIYYRENLRYFNNTEFDYAIDFEGYNFFNALLISTIENAKKSIWQHNDMNGEKELKFPKLYKTFQLYRLFDNVVSCGEYIYKVNKEHLVPQYYSIDKGKFAKNIIDINRIKNLRDSKNIIEIDGNKYFQFFESNLSEKLIPLIPEYDKSGKRNFRFVNIARLSPEKNQINLLKAVKLLIQKNYNIYLYIIGNGKAKSDVEEEIVSLGLTENVILTYMINNPISILAECDCFILPSLHEGQPMTVNEARMLKKPIIMSKFSSVEGVMIENGQYLCNFNSESIANAMEAYIKGKVPEEYNFDADEYNREAYNEFLNAIGAK